MSIYQIFHTDGAARNGLLKTVHGTVETPCFMNVATSAAIKGGVSALDLQQLLCTDIMLCNTYHLHVRPGDELVRALGGVRKFCGWRGVMLTDSGGFQVFSLAKLRDIREEGVTFASHVNGKRIFMGPEESIRIQSNLGSTIAMAFDECVANPATYEYTKASCERTLRWLIRGKQELRRLAQLEDTLNPQQLFFGINQGSTYDNLRLEHLQQIVAQDCDGYAIGGLAVGEPKEELYRITELVAPKMPQEKPRYLMGVGTPVDILSAVSAGVDLFDCVMPARNARHGHINTWRGVLNLHNAKFAREDLPLDESCDCPVCQHHSRAYLRHLLKSGEVLGLRLCVMHNLYFYNSLMRKIRTAFKQKNFAAFFHSHKHLDQKI